MKKILLGFAAIATLIGTPALAADMPLKAPPPPAPVMNWTGFYFGLEGGGGFAKTRQTDSSGVTCGTYSQAGGLFGVTGGYNWQFGNIVAGIEADFSWSDINGSVSVVRVRRRRRHCLLHQYALAHHRAGAPRRARR